MFGEKKQKRFIKKEDQGMNGGGVQIVVDTQTGVNYLMTVGYGPSGITPLLDRDGNVVIDR